MKILHYMGKARVATRAFAIRLSILLLLTVLLIALAAMANKHWQLLWNVSVSMPQRLYLLHRTASLPEGQQLRGKLIAFVAPDNPLYPQGSLFLKYVVGVPGDYADFWQDGDGHLQWLVAGNPLGSLRKVTSGGLPLHPGPKGHIPTGYLAVWAPHEDAYDSRYQDIGWIPAASIVGLATALW